MEGLGLSATIILKSVKTAKRECLDVFFNAKTHKVDVPFRVIVSENGTWQKAIALYLQSKLNR